MNAELAAVQQVIEGDVSAFEVIMRRYNQRLFRVARAILRDDDDAADAVQEGYIKAFNALDRFRGPRGLGSWLATIVRNEALQRLRKTRREVDLDDEVEIEGPRDVRPDERANIAQLRRVLEAEIDELPDAYRVTFMLRGVEGMSVRETAELLELNESTVRTQFHRAKRALRRRLSERLEIQSSGAFEYAGSRCDEIVERVLARIRRSIH